MSHTETHIGKLRKIDLGDKTAEQWAEDKCKSIGINVRKSYNKNWVDQFLDTGGYEKYFKVGDDIWEAFDHQELEEDDIDQFTLNADGTISFVTQFYNGGTCLSEVVEEGIERVIEK